MKIAALLSAFAWLIAVTWFAYLACMNVLPRIKTLTGAPKVLAYLLLVQGLVLDATLNAASSVVFLDPPHEWLLTARLRRYGALGRQWFPGLRFWRMELAGSICHRFLNAFDPKGRHC